MTSSLSWTAVDDKEFEHISLEIAQIEMPGLNFSLYLKKGNAQEGIDIKSVIGPDEKYTCIQCKHEKKFGKSDLRKIVDLLLAKEYASRTSRFILTTTADLQKADLQKYLRQLEAELLENNNIIFVQWDIADIETKLKRQFSLVQYYFGQESADTHCYHQLRIPSIPKRVPESQYIHRRVIPYEEKPSYRLLLWENYSANSMELSRLFEKENRFERQVICLIGDAHQGKSVLLRQAAYLLEQSEIPFTSLFLELKSQVIGPIAEMLTSEFGSWKQVPARDLIVFIDGLDEVPTEQFDETVKQIRAFTINNPRTSVVFSCRKIFYHHYRIKNTLTDFSFYELDSLRENDIVDFLKKQLRGKYSKFNQFIRNAKIGFLLQEPFYLVTLVKQFSAPPNERPETKIKIIEKVIEESFRHNEDRPIRDGRQIHQLYKDFVGVAQKIAFALQLSGTNAMDRANVQKILSQYEIDLLEHNSLITLHNDKWSFTNAIFQEHLAAMVLVEFPFERILSFATVGNKKRKIKTKWIETISSLLFLLDEQILKNQIFAFLEEDNIELLLTTEHSKYDQTLKQRILKGLIERCEKYHIRPMIIDEGTIASFIQNVPEGIDFLIGCLDSTYCTTVKISCARALKELHLSPSQAQQVLTNVKAELSTSKDTYVVNQILELLAIHKLGDLQLVEDLVDNKELNQYHEYRDGVYQLIVALDLSDNYCKYALDGIPTLINHNSSVTRMFSEYSLEQVIVNIKTRENFGLLFKALRNKEWLRFYQYSTNKEQILRKVFSNAAVAFENDPLIIFPIFDFIRTLGREYLREEYAEVDIFFQKTNNGWLASHVFIDELMSDSDWELGSLVTEDSFHYVLAEFEERNVPPHYLKSIAGALSYRKKTNLSERFMQLADDACGGIFSQPDPSIQAYIDHEKAKRSNDMYYIKSQDNFKEGLTKYFKAYGKKTIPEEDMFIDESSRLDRRKSDSTFINLMLSSWIRKNGVIRFNDAIKFVEDGVRFDKFRVQEIMNYNSRFEEDQQILEGIVKQYYEEGIQHAKFENCKWDVDPSKDQFNERYLWKEELLGKIYIKYRFPTPKARLMEMVWLDVSGIKGLDGGYNNSKTLSKMILDELDDLDKEIFAELIYSNISKGIKSHRVLATHIGLCKHLKIYDVVPFLLDLIQTNKCRGLGLVPVTDVYLALGGQTSELLGVFENLKTYDYQYLHYIEKLIESHPTEVKKSLLYCLEEPVVEEEIKAIVARYLCSLGDERGFMYLTGYVRSNHKAPFHIQGNVAISAIDTKSALLQLDDLIFLLAQPERQGVRFPESATGILIEWLYQFAAKSENDLDMVVKLLLAKQSEFKDQYPLHHNLFWYAFRAIENFRSADKEVKSVREIKSILSEVR